MRKRICCIAVLATLIFALSACTLFGGNKNDDQTTTEKYHYSFTMDGKAFSYEYVQKDNVPVSLTLSIDGTKEYEYVLSDAGATVSCSVSITDDYADLLLEDDGTFTFSYDWLENQKEVASDRIVSGYDYYAGDYSVITSGVERTAYSLRADGTATCGNLSGKFYPWSGNTVLVECGDKKDIITIEPRIVPPESTKRCYYRGEYTGTPLIGMGEHYSGELHYEGKGLYVKGDRVAMVFFEDTNRDGSYITFDSATKNENDLSFVTDNKTYTLDQDKKTFVEKPAHVYTAATNANKKLYVYDNYRITAIGNEAVAGTNLLFDEFHDCDGYYYTRFETSGYNFITILDEDFEGAAIYQEMADAVFAGLENVRTYTSDAPQSTANYGVLTDDYGFHFAVSSTELKLIGGATGTMYLRMSNQFYTVPAYYVFFYETDGDGNIKLAGTSRSVVRFTLHEDGTCTVLNAK